MLKYVKFSLLFVLITGLIVGGTFFHIDGLLNIACFYQIFITMLSFFTYKEEFQTIIEKTRWPQIPLALNATADIVVISLWVYNGYFLMGIAQLCEALNLFYLRIKVKELREWTQKQQSQQSS